MRPFRMLGICLALISFVADAQAQQTIQSRSLQPDGLELVSWKYARRGSGNTMTDFVRFGLFDPQKNELVLNMQYGLIRYSKLPGKYVVRDTATFRLAMYDAKQRKFLTDFVYHHIGDFADGISTVTLHDSTAKGTRSSVLYPDGKRASFIYDFLSETTSGRLRFKQQGRWGIIKNDGTMVRQAEFADMRAISDGLIGVRYEENGLLGYVDLNGKEVIPPSYEDGEVFLRGRAVVYAKRAGWKFTQGSSKNDQAGLINTRGEFIIPPTFTAIEHPVGTRSIFVVTNADRKKGIYDAQGKLLNDFTISYVGTWIKGKALVSNEGGNREGWLDTSGRWIIPPQYQAIDLKNTSYISARTRSKYDIYDSTGKKLFTIDTATRVVLGDKFALVMLHKKSVTIVDYQGKKIRTIEQPGLSDFSTRFKNRSSSVSDSVYVAYGNLITVHHLKTKKQQFITEANEFHHFSEGTLLMKNYDGFFWTDPSGKRLTTKNYFDARPFQEGIALARSSQYDQHVKLVNRAGQEIAQITGEPLTDFQEGILLFRNPTKRTVFAVDSVGKTLWTIDSATQATMLGKQLISIQNTRNKFMLYHTSGKRVTDSLYDQLGTVSDGLLGFKLRGRFGYMNVQGNIVIDPIYDGASNPNGKRMVVKLGPQVTIINLQGKRINDSLYTDGRTPLDNGIVAVAKDKKWGLVHSSGKTLVPCLYEDITWGADNRIFIKDKNVWYLADYAGKRVGTLNFGSVEAFVDGYARVKSAANLGLIDLQGNWVLKPIYKNMTSVQRDQVITFESIGGKDWPIKN